MVKLGTKNTITTIIPKRTERGIQEISTEEAVDDSHKDIIIEEKTILSSNDRNAITATIHTDHNTSNNRERKNDQKRIFLLLVFV